jgi:hypothetical protein
MFPRQLVDVEVGDVVVVVVGVLGGAVEVEVEVDVVDVDVVVVDGGEGVVVVVATPVSGETQPAGGASEPACPGINTVPAQPKSEKVDSLCVVDPSVKRAVESVCRMKPEASMETSTSVPREPCDCRMAFAA